MREPLGARAALLLGLLVGHTATVDELVAMVEEAVEFCLLDDLPAFWGNPSASLQALADAGAPTVRELLGRLERLGFARHVELAGSELWTTVEVPA